MGSTKRTFLPGLPAIKPLSILQLLVRQLEQARVELHDGLKIKKNSSSKPVLAVTWLSETVEHVVHVECLYDRLIQFVHDTGNES